MTEKTATLTVTVPEYLALGIQKQVAEGKFATESDAVTARLQQTDDYSWTPDGPIDGLTDEEWEKEIDRRMEENDLGEGTFFTLDEVRASLAANRAKRNAT